MIFHPRLRPALFALLVTTLSIIGFAIHMLMSSSISRSELHFDDDVRHFVSSVKSKLDTNEAVLAGFSAFLKAVDRSDTASATKYAAAISAAYPHIYMIEVARKIPVLQLKNFESSMQRDWNANFRIKSFSEITQRPSNGFENAPDAWPILFMYPSLPETQTIYGLRLETVSYLAHSLALSLHRVKPVASSVFDLYEGQRAYILLQEVTRPELATSEVDFFGNTMTALLLIKTQALVPNHNNDPEHSGDNFSASIISPENTESLLFEQQAPVASLVDKLFLPTFSRRLTIDNQSQPVVILYDRQLLWSELLSRETGTMFVLLIVALFATPWLIVRHYMTIERLALEHERSAYLATHDLLTDLPNRFLFADRFEQAFQSWQRNGNAFALMLLDLDHFKVINDTYGHDVGDQVLIACSKRMSQELRACDTVARHGGDEFVILLVNTANSPDAEQVGKKLLAAIAEPIETSAGLLKLSCSIGIALCPGDGDRMDILRKKADQAMYCSKEQGRNTVSVYSAVDTDI